MSDNKIALSTAQMRRIARYEMTFKDIIDDAPSITAQSSAGHGITLEDLYSAIKAMKETDPTLMVAINSVSFRSG